MKRLIIIIFVLCFIITGDLFTQEKGMRIIGKASEEFSGIVYRTAWAVVIGINKYPNVPQLDFAVSDAKSVAELLKTKFGFPESNIKILTDEQATKKGILDALNKLTDPKVVNEDDCVLIYFSGHGQTVPMPKTAGGGDMGFLVPYDAKVDLNKPNMSQYDEQCIGMDEFNKKALQIPAKHIIFIIDACYSGLIITGEKGLDPKTADFIKKVASVPSRQIITAGGKGDKASEDPILGHGLFTYKLLQGLEKGIADDNGDGVITGSELGNHLRGVVPKENPNQIPQYRMKGEGEFMFLPQVELAVPPKESSGADFSNIEDKIKRQQEIKKQQEEAERIRRQWDSKLSQMKEDYKKPKSYETQDISSDLKAEAYKVFLDAYTEDNPFTTEDDTMRSEAKNRIEYWRNQPKESNRQVIPGAKTIINEKDGAEMVLIPAGEFQMGSNDGDSNERPVHTVYLDAFYIDKYEVTNAQYKKFMDATGHKAPAYWNDSNFNAPNQPVVGVSWYDAEAYCKWAGKRLPTEAEWEKAARGGLVGKKYPWGDEISHDYANYYGTGGRDKWKYTSPVGSFPPNGYGLYDMAGNVWEWCADWYDENYYSKSPKSNPKGPDSGDYKVLRGGSWSHYDAYLRTAFRYFYLNPFNDDYGNVGFRCVQ